MGNGTQPNGSGSGVDDRPRSADDAIDESGWSAVVAAPPQVAEARLPGLDVAEQQSWQQFLDSSSLVFDALNRALTELHKLTLFDVLLLNLLARSEGESARMGDLAQTLMLIPSRVTQQIHRLESQGFVRRSASKGDRRGVSATLTFEGRRALAPALKTYAGVVRTHYLNQLTRQQMTALGDSCRRIDTPLKATHPQVKIGRI